MIGIFTMIYLGLVIWAIWVGVEANIRANEALRCFEHESKAPPLKFETPAVGPYARFADELHPRKFTAPPRS